MNLLVPGALAFAALAGPLIVLYMLRSKRRTVQVSSTMLWDRLGAPVAAAVPWQRLRLTPLLIIQLLVLSALVLSLARPFFTQQALLGPHTVFVIDSSGSMSDAGRFGAAIDRAEDLAGQASTANLISVVQAGPEAQVLAAFSRSPDVVRSALSGIVPGGAVADLSGAVRLARGLATPDRPTNLLIFSDGGSGPLAEEPVIGATHLPFDATSADVSIDGIDAESSDEGLIRVLVTATNHTTASRTDRFEIAVGELPAGTFELEMSSGGQVSKTIPVEASAGDVISVTRLGDSDTNPMNDSAWLIVGQGPLRTAELVGEPSPFVEALVRSLPGWEESDEGEVLIVDGGELPEIDRPALLFATDTVPEGIEFVELVGNVPVTYQRPGEPLLDQVDLSDVAVAEAQVVDAPGWLPIVRAGDSPLILLGSVNGHRAVYFTFDVTHSNLPVQVGFPILGARILEWLGGGSGASVSTGVSGDPIVLAAPVGTHPEVTRPTGEVVTLEESAALYKETTVPGIYRVRYVGNGLEQTGPTAVRNFVPAEAGVLPRTIAVASPPDLETEETALVREWAPWVIGLAIVLLLLEWWVGHQRPGLRRTKVATA